MTGFAKDGTEDFDLQTDKATNQTQMTLNYKHSSHQFTITGTNVVPEFPVALIGIASAVIRVAAVVGRVRIFKK
jgi:hypothetical protein